MLNSLKKRPVGYRTNCSKGSQDSWRIPYFASQPLGDAINASCVVHIHFEAGARDEKWLVLRTSIGCINKRQGSQATRDDSGKGISIHLSQRLHLLAGFATNPSHRNCIWEKMPRGMRGDIFFGPQGGSKGFCYCNNCYY